MQQIERYRFKDGAILIAGDTSDQVRNKLEDRIDDKMF